MVLSQIEMIDRLVSHIPAEKNFRAIRYYGFLSNRKRREALPLVYDLLDQEEPKQLNYAQMMHHLVGQMYSVQWSHVFCEDGNGAA
ncbi:TPA: transposase [Photobacterium damselae]